MPALLWSVDESPLPADRLEAVLAGRLEAVLAGRLEAVRVRDGASRV
jgi:hypothetical protein